MPSSRKGNQNYSQSPKHKYTCVSPASPEMAVTMGNLRKSLKEELMPIQSHFDEFKKSIDFTSTKLDQMLQISEKVEKLEKDQASLDHRLSSCENRYDGLEEKILSLELYSRKNNLKFFNMKSTNTTAVSQQDCASLVIKVCETFGVSITVADIEEAHRIGNITKKDRPMIVRFSSISTRNKVLQIRSQLRDTGIVVTEDFPAKIMERRKMFTPVLKAAYESQGKYKAKLIADKLLLNGAIFTMNEIEKLPKDLQPSNLSTIKKANIIAFFGHSSKLSNHHRCIFTVNGTEFISVEQFYMYSKASHFHDHSTALEIMKSENPILAWSLGKKMKGFDQENWRSVQNAFMKSGLNAKFQQNPELGKYLEDTADCMLVEANPHDSYWGVGLPLHGAGTWQQELWKGKNMLGKLLMEVREGL